MKDNHREDLAGCLRQLIENGKIRVLLGIRSDFADLLANLCRKADPDLNVLSPLNWYSLRPFLKDQALDVIKELLRPITGDDRLKTYEAECFANEFVAELLRTPTDPRLSKEDEKSVLPVELQMIGMMLESTGIQSLTPGVIQRMGGRVGIHKAYLEDVKNYVWRKTGLPAHKAMPILRELISPSGTTLSAAPIVVAKKLGLSTEMVKNTLDAFAEKYLVKPVAIKGSDGPEMPRYELLHEHWVQVLEEVPDSTLQREREAAKSLQFWLDRTARVLAGDSTSVLGRIHRWLARPIPLGETLRLWRYARSLDSQRMLKRTLRRYILTALVWLIAIGIPGTAYTLWTRSDSYQISKIIADAPVKEAYALGEREAVQTWVKSLARTGREPNAVDVAIATKDDLLLVSAFIARAEDFCRSNSETAKGEWKKAISVADRLVDKDTRDRAFDLIAEAFRRCGLAERIHELNTKNPEPNDTEEKKKRQIESLVASGCIDDAMGVAAEWSKQQQGLEWSSANDDVIRCIFDAYLSAGNTDGAQRSITIMGFNGSKVVPHVCLAKYCETHKDTDSADNEWKLAIECAFSDEFDRPSPEAIYFLGTELQKYDKNDEKVKDFVTRLLRWRPSSSQWPSFVDSKISRIVARFAGLSRGIDVAIISDVTNLYEYAKHGPGNNFF